MTYIITEKQNVNSNRDGGRKFTGKLTSAKRIASREQFFQGTVLTVETESGTLVSYKKPGQKWMDC